jgi:predicted house-cleaning NTP pyrophosphatase (Maf/HAM1 superfamily)
MEYVVEKEMKKKDGCLNIQLFSNSSKRKIKGESNKTAGIPLVGSPYPLK